MKLERLKSDPRFCVDLVHTGKPRPMWQIRFMDETLGERSTRGAALIAAAAAASDRREFIKTGKWLKPIETQ